MGPVTVPKNAQLEVESNQGHVLEDMGCVAHVSLKLQSYVELKKEVLMSESILVQKSCGDTSSENCTYFQSSGTEVGQCRLRICPCNDNICQLRLDFQTFVINQPKTSKLCLCQFIQVIS